MDYKTGVGVEKIVKYEIKLLVKNHNTQHIKKFENVLYKVVNTSGLGGTEISSVKEIK
jgi:hypothetical protein